MDPGELPWTDGVAVFVDEEASLGDQVRAVAVQASLLAAGSLGPDIAARLHRRPALARRYLAVEGHRALAVHAAVLPRPARLLVDRSGAALSDGPTASLALAAGRAPIDDPPAVFGTIHPRQLRTAPAARPGADANGDDPAARHVPRTERQQLRELDDGEDADSAGAFDMFNPIGGGGAVGRLLQRLLGNARSKGGGQPGADAPTHRTGRGGRVTRGAAMSATRVPLPDDVDGTPRRGATYPEWNVHERRYRPGWCTVTEQVPESRPEGEGDGRGVPADAHALRRPLARLGIELERRRRQLQGDDIDIDAAVEARVDAGRRVPPDEDVYVDSRAAPPRPVVAGPARRLGLRRRTERRRARTRARAPAGRGRRAGRRAARPRRPGRALRVPLAGPRGGAGAAGEALRRPARRRACCGASAAWRPGAYTRLGAAIRHGAASSRSEGGTPRRLLVVLSDGFAYDHGYEGAYGEADARRALAEARRRGMGCLCLSVGADTEPDALRRVFGTAAHAAIPHARAAARH